MTVNRECFSVEDVLKMYKDGKLSLGDCKCDRGLLESVIYEQKTCGNIGPMTMYASGEDRYRVMDGSKRLYHLLEFLIDFEYEVDGQSFDDWSKVEKSAFMKSEIFAYVVSGDAAECYDYFDRSNFVSVSDSCRSVLSDIVYGGAWLDDQRFRFAEGLDSECILGLDSVFGGISKDDLLHKCVSWYANREDEGVAEFMKSMQSRTDKVDLLSYVSSICNWVTRVFGTDHLELFMNEPWGEWYNDYGMMTNDEDFSEVVDRLAQDDSVGNKSGIVEYLLTGETDCLKLKKFSKKDCADKLAEQGGVCKHCGCALTEKDARISCLKPWPNGTVSLDNSEVLCKKCDKAKKDRYFSVFG